MLSTVYIVVTNSLLVSRHNISQSCKNILFKFYLNSDTNTSIQKVFYIHFNKF